MAYSLSLTTITQTGTDNSLSGLSGLSGVSVIASSTGKLIYVLDNRQLFIDGTQIIDPDVECLVFLNNCPYPNLDYRGTLQIGRKRTAGGRVRYSEGDAILINRQSPLWANSTLYGGIVSTANGSTFLGYGGRIVSASPVSLCGINGTPRTGTVTIESLRYYACRTADRNGAQFRLDNSLGQTVNVSGLELDCDVVGIENAAVILFQNDFTSFNAAFKAYTLQSYISSPEDLTFQNLEFGQNYRDDDYIGNTDPGVVPAVPVFTFNNTDVGTATRCRTLTNRSLNALFTQDIKVNLKDSSNSPITSGLNMWIRETDDGNRFQPLGRTGFDWTTVLTYDIPVDGTGSCEANVRTGIKRKNQNNALQESFFGKSSADDFDVFVYGYNYSVGQSTQVLRATGGLEYGQPMLADGSISQSNKATVDAYATIDTPQQFYDRAKSWLVDNYSGQAENIVSRSGNSLDAKAYNVTIDATAPTAWSVSGNAITIKSSVFTGDMTTTGVITLANGAQFIGTRTDANGTVAPPKVVSISGFVSGSRLRIYNDTTGTEIVNQVVAGTSYTTTYSEGTGYTTGDTVTVSVAWNGGATAKLPFTAQTVVGASGWSMLVSQQDDIVYNSNGINGTTVTEFTFDYPNVQVDISDPDGSTTLTRLYAWWAAERTTEQGIRQLIGGLVAEDAANYKVITSVVNLKLDNTSAIGVTFSGDLRLYRDDGSAPVVSSTSGGGSITLYAGKVYTSVVSTASPVITGDITDVADVVWDAVLANHQTAGTTGEALDSAAAGGGGGGGGATAQQVWEYASRTLTASSDPSAAAIATAVRSELGTELGRIDATITSRAAAGDAMTLTTGERASVGTAVWDKDISTYANAGEAGTLLKVAESNTTSIRTTDVLKANVVQISGDTAAADNFESYCDGTTPMPVNVTQLSGDSTAADNLESYCDGTTPIPANATQISGSSTAADVLELLHVSAITSGTVGSGSFTTTVFQTDLNEADNFHNKAIVVFTSGALAGQARVISDYANANGAVTVSEAFTSAPVTGSTFLVIGRSQ